MNRHETKLPLFVTDILVMNCCAWWGGWGDGLGQISCPVVGWGPQAALVPSVQMSPIQSFVSAPPPGVRGPGSGGKCWSQYEGSWWSWTKRWIKQVVMTAVITCICHFWKDKDFWYLIRTNSPLSIEFFCNFHGLFGTYSQLTRCQFFHLLLT